MVETADIVGIIGIIVASPILIVLTLILGGAALVTMTDMFTNILAIGLIILLNTIFYIFDRISYSTVLFTGLIIGFIFWVIGIMMFLSEPTGAICQIPVLGTIACGAGTLLSMFIHLPGNLLGAIIISAAVGTFLILLSKT